MKFYTNSIVSYMTLVAAGIATSVNAGVNIPGNEDGETLPYATAQVKNSPVKLTDLSKFESSHINEYFVVLTDSPLATYDGSNVNFAATNMLASKGSNATKTGKLNTKSLASKRYRNYLSGKQKEAQLHVELKLKRKVEIKRSFSIVMNGFVAELTPSEAVLLGQLDGIKLVEKVGFDQIDTDSGPSYSGADNVWNGSADLQIPGNKGEGIIVAVLDSGIASFQHPVEDIFDTENLPPFHPSFADIGGDGYDHENPRGEGNYIGDCVDAPNWCNDKLIGVVGVGVFGVDIINKSYDDARTRTGQDANGHGTHTASTAAGNVVKNIRTESELGKGLRRVYDESFVYEQISGVAPHANIISYQICSPLGSCNQSYAIDAIEHAIDVEADVINYSVSGPSHSPWYQASALAFLAAREAGIHVAASAGNSGMNGSYTVRTPANAPWVTAIAANTHNRDFNDKVLTLSGGPKEFDVDQFIGSGATTGLGLTDVVFAEDVEYTGEGSHSHTHTHSSLDEDDYIHASYDEHSYQTDEDNKTIAYEHTHVHHNINAEDVYKIAGACGADSISAEKVAGKVVICNRGGSDEDGGLSRISKSYHVQNLGAAGMILINTSDTFFDTTNDDLHTIPAVHLKRKAGKQLLEWLAQGSDHQVAINASSLVANDDVGGIMGDFSSRGPDLFSHDYLVPDISAAGVKVLAAGMGDGMADIRKDPEITSDKDFLYMTGTSMSSPHVAGMFALIKKAQPLWTPAEAQSALMLTAGTGLKNYGEYKNDEITYEPANLHQTGAGLARVDLAIASGLIMNETEKGYMIADPLGDVPGLKISAPDSEDEDQGNESTEDLRDLTREPIEDWHGEPSRINLASLSKGDCEIECSWTRTFKATKDASWEISYSYLSEGFELSSDTDGKTIDVSAGDEFSITFYATLTGTLEDIWVNGRVHLTANNDTIPPVSLPVAVEFVAGQTPENIDITAHRNQGSASVAGVITVGSDDLTITQSSLSKADIYTGTVQRAEHPTEIWKDVKQSDRRGMVAIPLNIPYGASRLVIEVLETSSPDLDIFVGVDGDSDGFIDIPELDLVYFWGTNPGANEMLDYQTPRNGGYWIMVHNFGDHYNNSDHEEFDPAALVIDTFKISVSVVPGDDDSLTINAPKAIARGAEVPVTLNWDKEMTEGERYYGLFHVATSKNQLSNVGTVNVNLNRGEDDVKLSLLSHDAKSERAGFDITLAANNSGQDKNYQLSIDLVAGSTVESLSQQAQQAGVAAQSAGEDIQYNQDGNTLTWEYVHANGAPAQNVSLIINYTDVEGFTDVTPAVYSVLDEQDEGEFSTMTDKVMVHGRPIFALNSSEQLVDPGTSVTLSAQVIDAVIENSSISYNWVQIEGPRVDFNANDKVISFVVPNDADGKSYAFEMTGHNGERSAVTETIALKVTGEDVGKSGSFNWLLSVLALLTLCARNCATRRNS
ncbi:S8 family serine peptidase [Thalassotalea fonticola]|uniref:S8 family serine peptidase n=1 Tax=Thalassotalea fonticola TaxID=3065649 RepID=A0ABZ0GS58_9GAMM|nr:S8 family serine peptidase [Colwelliaceae bacterium S1-1]